MGQDCFADISLSGLGNHSFLHVYLASEIVIWVGESFVYLASEIVMRFVALMSTTNANHSGVSQY